MSAPLKLADVYVGSESSYLRDRTGFGNSPWHREHKPRAIVVGDAFGPRLLCAGASLEEAIDEWDERHGLRVEPDDSALADYQGESVQDRIEAAVNCGDIRMNDGGTMVWVDHCEWFRTFSSVREAGRFFRNGGAS